MSPATGTARPAPETAGDTHLEGIQEFQDPVFGQVVALGDDPRVQALGQEPLRLLQELAH